MRIVTGVRFPRSIRSWKLRNQSAGEPENLRPSQHLLSQVNELYWYKCTQ